MSKVKQDKVSQGKAKQSKHMKCYAIRDSLTGLYSTGGTCPDWNAVGKRWSNIGHVKNHLRTWRENGGYQNRPIPLNWEVVEFKLVESENYSCGYPISAWALKT